MDDASLIITMDNEYEASGGIEHFISIEYDDMVAGYVRLRLDDGDIASIRELKVFGRMEGIGEHGDEWQHRGLGKELMAKAEEKAKAAGKKTMRITSGAGVRKYYESLGYGYSRPYMTKLIA
jgi:elongator complex protein 3